METRSLGTLRVSVLGLGANNVGLRLDQSATGDVVRAALDHGITYIDTAESYGGGNSEVFLGRALGRRRDEVVLATKWGGAMPDDAGRGREAVVRRCCEASLARLGVDHIDHLQMHKPDPGTDIAETLGALADLRAEGKILESGCSNVDAAHLQQAIDAAAAAGIAGFASVQNRYSVLTRTPETDGVRDLCERHALALVPFFPLESGVLTGKYAAGEDPPPGSRLALWSAGPQAHVADQFLGGDLRARARRLQTWAEGHDHSLLELAFGWLASQPSVATIIAGATTAEQVRANASAVEWRLDEELLAEVDAVLGG